jgi:hypothetical protein
MIERSQFGLLSARIDSLERQSKVLKRLLVCSFAGLLALLAGGATIAQQKQIVFSNANGSVRVGSSGFGLYDTSGKRRLMLGWNSSSQPGIYLTDGSGTYRMGIYLSDQARPVVRLYDVKGTVRADFAEGTEGGPVLKFYDASNTEREVLGQSTDDNPIVKIFDTSHNLRVYAGAYASGAYGMYVNDSAGTTTWQSP